MNILVACEKSGVVKAAFKAKGHTVISCDIQPGMGSRTHYQGDVKDLLQMPWDMVIAFPPCTFLCNSGVRWLFTEPGRWEKLENARIFFMLFYNLPCKKICIENPVPHHYANLPPYTQIIQPFEHGHGETKKTCLWLKGLPPLVPRRVMKGRENRIHKMSPSPSRSDDRSRTFYGIARSMAEQWG